MTAKKKGNYNLKNNKENGFHSKSNKHTKEGRAYENDYDTDDYSKDDHSSYVDDYKTGKSYKEGRSYEDDIDTTDIGKRNEDGVGMVEFRDNPEKDYSYDTKKNVPPLDTSNNVGKLDYFEASRGSAKGGGDNVEEYENESPAKPETTGSSNPFTRFIERFGDILFRNSADINRFFADHSDQDNFMAWFKDEVGGRSHWRERNIPHRNFDKHLNNFNEVWDNIPLLYTGNVGSFEINIFQFFALASIIINETGGTFRPIRERGSLAYMFGTNGGRKRSYNNYPQNRPNNRTAFQLFNDRDFLETHSDLDHYEDVANTTNRAWNGDTYPAGFPTDPAQGGIIAEADFYKFSGRGLVQTTWRRNYEAYIELVQQYGGNDQVLNAYKERWNRAFESLNIGIIATQTSNRDWDSLFLGTHMEFAAMAVYAFQHRRNDFLTIPVDASILQRETNRSGSLYYVGYRVGGRESYGRKVKNRVIQMMNTLL
ncbi:hypothetical protein [Galbibacter sp.]|uniref:hypothetical protein n=1 Tax=Galbibacter sp. TaxID=2918471 RepID=UPI003A9020BE